MGKVGFLGIGTMGSRMSARLLAAGHELTVWNRTVEKTLPLRQKGAAVAATPAEAAARQGHRARQPHRRGRAERDRRAGRRARGRSLPPIFVDMATIAPAESAKIAGSAGARVSPSCAPR